MVLSTAVPVAKRIVVLSDLHITPATALGNFTAGPSLAAWTLEQSDIANADTILVLAGDIIDFLLLEQRPDTIELATAPALIDATLRRLSDQPWVDAWRTGLCQWHRSGARIVLIPGNHDPEWYHPRSSDILNRWITDNANDKVADVWRRSGPWTAKVGAWDVVIGHGNRADPVNDIDPDQIHRALRNGEASVPMPPGSQLVTGALANFKRAVHPETGKRLFPFIDAVKPETLSVLLLMLYLNPRLVRERLPTAFGPLFEMFARSIHRRLFGGAALSPSQDRSSESTEDVLTLVESLSEDIAEPLFAALSERERSQPAPTMSRFTLHLESDESLAHALTGASTRQTLATHSGLFRGLLRAWLRCEAAHSGSFYSLTDRNQVDQAIIDECGSKYQGPLIAIAGHTHAARKIEFGPNQMYLNTGTWTNMIDLSPYQDDDQGLRQLIDAMETDSLTYLQRLTWGEVTPAGGELCHYHREQ